MDIPSIRGNEDDEFVPEHLPEPGEFLRGNEMLVGDDRERRRHLRDEKAREQAEADRDDQEGDERLAAVLVTAPPPTDAEHDPVRRGLREGTFEP